MEIYVILANGIEYAPNGSVIIDTKGKWETVRSNDRNEQIIAYSDKSAAELMLNHMIGEAKCYNKDPKIQFKLVSFQV